MEAALFIFSLIDCCALIFLAVYFVSFVCGRSFGGCRVVVALKGDVQSLREVFRLTDLLIYLLYDFRPAPSLPPVPLSCDCFKQ
ncbi:hypothetical protein GDO78_019140 [Eleutherodactylus coqui]|uniref:Uncharacterized protein n=1 Tax=Eleutherodactylus coqui TaxID=57060 RepID=A0A8J6BBQ6_ELECQ|nr:hypothetical protein GDO78_019140 [Eleutherodactylus coqui]